MPRYTAACLAGALLLSLAGGCSIRGYALRAAADAVSAQGGGYSEEEDPELARDAAPFGLKTMEQLFRSVPDHRGLPLALASGFTQYTYAFVQQEADQAEDRNIQQAKAGWLRARRLYLRARDYALRGLEQRHPGLYKALLAPDAAGRAAALARARREDVPLLYWGGASWALAISDAKDDAGMIGDLATVEAIMARALALQEDYDQGALHEFYISYDASRSKESGGGPERARQHLERALQLSKGHRVGPLVSYAEAVLVPQQKKDEFARMLRQVLDINVYADEEAWRRERLANIVNQNRARWLLSRLGDLFAE